MEPGSGDLVGLNNSESLSNTFGVVTTVAMGEDSKPESVYSGALSSPGG